MKIVIFLLMCFCAISSVFSDVVSSEKPTPSYAGRILARIKPNITLTDFDVINQNPNAEVEVICSPDGIITQRRIIKTSGNRTWDEAVLRAIDKTAILPKDINGTVYSPIIISFKPYDGSYYIQPEKMEFNRDATQDRIVGNYRDHKLESPASVSTDAFLNLLNRNAIEAFEDEKFKRLFEEVTKPQDRKMIMNAGWEDFKVIKLGKYIVGQGQVPRSTGWGLCGGGVFILNPINGALNVHICNQAKVRSFGKNTTENFMTENYPPEIKQWLCDTYDGTMRRMFKCQ